MKKLYTILFLAALMVSACDHAAKTEQTLVTGWYHVVDSETGVERQLGDSLTYYLDPQPVITAAHFKAATTESFPHDSTLWQVVVHLDDTGRERFARATDELIGEDLVFVLDDSLWTEPIRIQAKIPNGVIVINKWQFSKEEAEELIGKIDVGKR
ncbi:SecDF P1 head subdomain-containing protein [Parapedobacter sp. 10938]|uniref:SecDF P1 head subdomain-containing protein n=1 Tax=Parapedobacter flavus TaxID=3110225 RepID=UPI002DBDBE76|nr:hypothetical protein [Parapedobacter sp. 10938]MEC3880085.1 hypothetical protein [Parapedobacter sp. 10938]